MSKKQPDYFMTNDLQVLESFKMKFSDALKVVGEEGKGKEVEVLRACILQLQVQIDDLQAEKIIE